MKGILLHFLKISGVCKADRLAHIALTEACGNISLFLLHGEVADKITGNFLFGDRFCIDRHTSGPDRRQKCVEIICV